MNPTFIQHTTNPTIVEVCVSFFLPTDARHWIPNGVAHVDCVVDADDLEDDWIVTLEEAAEAWCEQTHGKGSFSQVIIEP